MLIHFAQTLPWHWPGHRSPAPFYVFLFSRQMSSISVASALQPLPLRGAHFLQQAPAVQCAEKGNRQVTAVQGVRGAHQKRNAETLMMGQMGTGTLEFPGTVFYRTISIFYK